MTKKYFSSKQEIISHEYHTIKEIASNVLRKNEDVYFLDDLTQEVCLILLNQDDESIMTIHEQGYFKFYVARIITNQVLSTTSPFHKKYRLKVPYIDFVEEDYNPLADKIWLDAKKYLTKKQKKIVNMRYVYGLKIDKIAQIQGVSKRQIYKDLDNINNILRKKI